MSRKRKKYPRCQFGFYWKNPKTGETGWIQCGGAGRNRYEMCKEPDEHFPRPEKMDENTGWPVVFGAWTVENIVPPRSTGSTSP